jgi:DNA-binding winged helix-turn-helix (wHTH) protein
MTTQEPLRFGPFTLDSDTLELWHAGARVALEPLPARLLGRLAHSAGSVVPRHELLALGWPPESAVTDQALNTCIHEIRHALKSDARNSVRVETLRRRGYRLVVDAVARDASQRRLPLSRKAAPWIAAAVVIVAATFMARYLRQDVMPREAQHYLDRARYLADETEDAYGARAVLDSARVRFPRVAALHAEWAELSALVGALDDARHAVAVALRLEPRQATAQRTAGMLALLAGKWAAADSALARALDADAGDSRTLTALAFRRVIQGRFAAMDTLVRQALQSDPLSVATHRDAGMLYLLAGRYGDAERFCRETLRFKPRSRWAIDCLFDVMTLTGRVDQAADWGRRLLRLYGAPAPSATASAESAVAATESWRLAAWSRAVSHGANPFGLALAYAANGRVDEAMDALRAAIDRPSLGVLTIAVDPRLASLRERAGFAELLNRLKLAA